MRMTPEMLKKYHRGQCSPVEKLAAEAWLANPEEQQHDAFPEKENENDVKEMMWNNISSFMDDEAPQAQTKQLNWGWHLRRLAAACFVLACVGWATSQWYPGKNNVTELSMDNRDGSSNREMIHSGLTFTLTPKSKAETTTDWDNKSGFVNFSGNILITNNSDEDIELRFNTSSQSSARTQKILKCEKGRTYVAIHYKFNDDEIMVFDKSDLTTTLLPIQVYNQLERI